MIGSPPTVAELKQHFKARTAFLQATRDKELREVSAADAIENILAVDGFVVMTAHTQTDRDDFGMQEQQRLFRQMRVAPHG